jgi:hypothetical protein
VKAASDAAFGGKQVLQISQKQPSLVESSGITVFKSLVHQHGFDLAHHIRRRVRGTRKVTLSVCGTARAIRKASLDARAEN